MARRLGRLLAAMAMLSFLFAGAFHCQPTMDKTLTHAAGHPGDRHHGHEGEPARVCEFLRLAAAFDLPADPRPMADGPSRYCIETPQRLAIVSALPDTLDPAKPPRAPPVA